MWRLPYQLAYGLGLLAYAPVALAPRERRRHYLATLPGRLVRPDADTGAARPGGLWIHAVSVGETLVAADLARSLPAGLPAVVTTVTPTGQALARERFADTTTAYLPFDLAPLVRRFFDRHRPRALVVMESDRWPVMLDEAHRRGVPVAVVNGRIGDTSFARLERLRRWAPGLLDPLFEPVGRFGVQSPEDRRRLLALGVPEERVTVTGNLKYEIRRPEPRRELEAVLATLAGGRPILVAGSTMRAPDGADEEDAVLAGFEVAGGGGEALLVLAPRHPERFDRVAERIAGRGHRVLRRSTLGDPPSLDGERDDGRVDVVLLDTLGELAAVYGVATAAFVGGTLVPTGGHNPLEVAVHGVPVVVGPSMENFRPMERDFDRADAWGRAQDAAALGRLWRSWLDHPDEARAVGERGRALIEASRGALEATRELLAPLLARVGAGPEPKDAPEGAPGDAPGDAP